METLSTPSISSELLCGFARKSGCVSWGSTSTGVAAAIKALMAKRQKLDFQLSSTGRIQPLSACSICSRNIVGTCKHLEQTLAVVELKIQSFRSILSWRPWWLSPAVLGSCCTCDVSTSPGEAQLLLEELDSTLDYLTRPDEDPCVIAFHGIP